MFGLEEYLIRKHQADEHLLTKCDNLIGTVIRPGFIYDKQRLWSLPLRYGVDLANCFDEYQPNFIKKYQLIPDEAISLDVVAYAAGEASLGRVDHGAFTNILSNELLREYQRKNVPTFMTNWE